MDKGKSYEPPTWSAPPSAEFQLEVLKDGSIVDTIDLKDKEFFTLGRQHGLVDITMDHPSISRVHAVLNFRDDGALMLRDMGSAQGTQLNKTPCENGTYYRVYVGDMIKFGASTRKYIIVGPEEYRKEEYNSANMENYREKLAVRSAEIKEKLEKEAEKDAFSWGMREDAEATEDVDDKPEEELPEYLKKLRNDEHFERKFGEKFSADIKESEAKNSKDAEILDKIRKKERKIQNMQEENRRIYLKENTQEAGLTEGQMAAVNRNDKSITLLQEEIEQLINQIRAKSADRVGPEGGTTSSKRSIHEAEDDILDLTTQTADASTNWRLRKKLQKTTNVTTGNATGEAENHALSYAEIKQQLATQTELRAKLDQQVEETKAFIYAQESVLAAGAAVMSSGGEDIDSVLARDRAAEGRTTLKRLQNEQGAMALKVSRLEKLLKVATPALISLVNKKPSLPPTASAAPGADETTPAAAAAAPEAVPAKIQGPSRGPRSVTADGAAITDSSSSEHRANNAPLPTGEDRLKNLMRFIDEEKEAEEQVARRKKEDDAAKALEEQRKRSKPIVLEKKAGEEAAPASSESVAPAAKATFSAITKTVVGKTPSSGPPRVQGPQGPPRFRENTLEGGESDWVPPPKQSGDGKTALNAKYGY